MTEALYAVASKLYRIVRPVRDRHYLQHIRTFPCVACKTTKRQREAMHTGPRGLSQKASDRDSLPGCRPCHRELAETCGELMDLCRAHRLTCPTCGPVELPRKAFTVETGEPCRQKEAA